MAEIIQVKVPGPKGDPGILTLDEASQPVVQAAAATALSQNATVVAAAELAVGDVLLAQVEARLFGYYDHNNVSGVLLVDPLVGTHVLNATAPLLISIADAIDGTLFSIFVETGASFVAVDGIADFSMQDETFATFERIRGAWKLATNSGITGVPDATAPGNVTGVVFTGGEASATLSWAAATEDVSVVHYAYRIWPTSGGATGPYLSTDALSVNFAALAAGNYTAQVYAYSAGGASAVASATATVTVPPGWNVIVDDPFTGVDGTLINGRTAGGTTWTEASNKAKIVSNMLVLDQTVETRGANMSFTLPEAAGSAGVEIWVYYDLLEMLDSSTASFQINWSDSPAINCGQNWNGVSSQIRAGISGYNASSSYIDLLANVDIQAISSGAGKFGVRRTNNLIELLNNAGAVAGSLNLTDGYSGYSNKAIPGSFGINLNNFVRSKIDRVTASVFS